MSISNFQEKFIKGGCGKAILVFSAVAMAVGLGFSSCGRGATLGAKNAQGQPEQSFATVGSVELASGWVDKIVENQTKQMGGMIDQLPPEYKVGIYAQSVNQLIQRAHMYEYAKREGYKTEDKDLLALLKLDSEASMKAEIRKSLVEGKQLDEKATDADFDKKFKELSSGSTVSEFYKKQREGVDKALSDTSLKPLAIMELAQQYLSKKLGENMKPTEDEIKNSFENYEVKIISVKLSNTMNDAQAKEKAQKAYDALKTGTSFESAITTYSDEPAAQGKSKADSIYPKSKAEIEGTPDLKPILALQPGDFTTPIKTFDGYSIFKYAGKKVTLPPDYEKNKEAIKKQFIATQVAKKVDEEVKKIDRETTPKFHLAAYEAAYLFSKASAPEGGATPKTEDFQKVIDLCKAVKETETGSTLALDLMMAASDRMSSVPGADVAKLKPQRLEVISSYLKQRDNWRYRKELVDSYIDSKDGDKATEQLLVAMDKNNKYDQAGQATFSEINGSFLKLKTANLVKPEKEKDFKAKQEQWQKDKKQYDDMQAQEKARQDAEMKKAAEEAKKAEAEKKKSEKKDK